MSKLRHTANIKTLTGLLLLITLVVYLGWLGRNYLQQQRGQTEILAQESCQPDQDNCQISLPDRNIHFRMQTNSGELHSGAPIKVTVSIEGASTQAREVSFQGKDMYMGENHYPLETTGDGTFATDLQLPVCTTGKMTWQALIKLEQEQGVIFEFESE